MNAWPFIVGAYALTILGTLAILVWSYLAMRRAETEADTFRSDR
jgi:hypothetical protein